MSSIVPPVYYPGPRPLTITDVLLFLFYGSIFLILPALGVTLLIRRLFMKHLKKLFTNKFYKAAISTGIFIVSFATFAGILLWLIKILTPRIIF